jgi:phage shock protein A
MPDLLNKLNVLVRASLNNVLGSAGQEVRNLPSTVLERLGNNLEGEVNALRRRIEQAISEEEEMQAKIAKLTAQDQQLDTHADDAVASHDDATARNLLEQQRRVKQQIVMLESELAQHKRATEDLIQHVNVLDSALRDKQHAAQRASAPSEPAPMSTNAVEPSLSDMLRDAREQAEVPIPIKQSTAPATPVPPPTSDSEAGVSIPIKLNRTEPSQPDPIEEDLARRRSRLSKPD